MNPEGGFYGMPTQFLGTVRLGGQHRVPRWVAITEHSSKQWPPYQVDQTCRSTMKMFIPHENAQLSSIQLPLSPALQRFVDIAWDGVDSVDSAWDSCEVGC